ncbi:MAG: hypothetical protein J1F14_04125 [Treponema sp.]|nr:hypothetical protein [Treponema sp.]
MNANEWFACLGYRTVDILIPQDNIFESVYCAPSSIGGAQDFCEVFHIDDFISNVFGEKFTGPEVARLIIKGEQPLAVKSRIVPDVIQIDFDTFTISKGIMGKKLFSIGILASRFEDNRVQYLLDINQIHSKWRQR